MWSQLTLSASKCAQISYVQFFKQYLLESFSRQFVFQLIYFAYDKASLPNETAKKVLLNMVIQDQPNPVYLFWHTNLTLSLFDNVKHFKWQLNLNVVLKNDSVEWILYEKFYHLFLNWCRFYCTTNCGHFFIGKLCATIRNKVMMALKQLII
jgi:hypothetical protein